MMLLLFTRLFPQSKSPQKPADACELFDAEFVLGNSNAVWVAWESLCVADSQLSGAFWDGALELN
jgi:hypothetical protein